jgi:hypothetical protein
MLKTFFISFVLTLLSNNVAQAQVNFPVERPKLNVGDTWKYQRSDLWRNEVLPGFTTISVRAVNERSYSFVGTNRDGTAFNDNNTNFDLNWTQTVRGELQTHSNFQWPLTQGSSHNHKNRQTRAENEWTNDTTCSVVGSEQTKVPAGDFATVKIVCKRFWNMTTGNSGSAEDIRWYAPIAKRVVKQQSRFWQGSRLDTQTLDELVEYKLN